MGLALAGPLFAVERPTPADAPKEKGERVEAPGGGVDEAMPQAVEQKTAWLGVAGSPVSETLSYHLGLQKGNGISLELVAPDSPAAKAGLKRHDVITKIGDFKIESMNDLRMAIKGQKPGAAIEAEIYAKGKAEKREITLVERPANLPMMPGPNDAAREGLRQFMVNPDAMPKNLFEGMGAEERKMMEKMLRGRFKDLQKELDGARLNFEQIPGANGAQFQKLKLKDLIAGAKVKSRTSITMLDKNGRKFKLQTDDNGQELEIKDREGKLLFNGPFNTDVDKEAVPEELREEVERLGIGGDQNGNNFRIEILPNR